MARGLIIPANTYAEECGDWPGIWLYDEQPTKADDDRWMPKFEDMWRVDVSGLDIREENAGLFRCVVPIATARLTLLTKP